MRTHHLIIAAILITLPLAAQQRPWNVKPTHEIPPLRQMPPADQQGITSRLHMKTAQLGAERISTQPDDIFFVQSFGSDTCGAVGNCRFWVLDSRYNIILKDAARWAKLLPTSHGGHHDVITSLHNSAFDSDLTQWRFNGARYREYACADVTYLDPTGKPYKRPRVAPIPCR
jgi:hypothetical protein